MRKIANIFFVLLILILFPFSSFADTVISKGKISFSIPSGFEESYFGYMDENKNHILVFGTDYDESVYYSNTGECIQFLMEFAGNPTDYLICQIDECAGIVWNDKGESSFITTIALSNRESWARISVSSKSQNASIEIAAYILASMSAKEIPASK